MRPRTGVRKGTECTTGFPRRQHQTGSAQPRPLSAHGTVSPRPSPSEIGPMNRRGPPAVYTAQMHHPWVAQPGTETEPAMEEGTMKSYSNPIAAACTLLVVGTTIGTPRAAAGDREWAVAGKVLTGVLAARVLSEAVTPRTRCGTELVRRVVVVHAAPRSHGCEVRVVPSQQQCVSRGPSRYRRHGTHNRHGRRTHRRHGHWRRRPVDTVVYRTTVPTRACRSTVHTRPAIVHGGTSRGHGRTTGAVHTRAIETGRRRTW